MTHPTLPSAPKDGDRLIGPNGTKIYFRGEWQDNPSHEALLATGLHECASDCQQRYGALPVSRFGDHYDQSSRVSGPRIWYTDRRGRRRWKRAE